MTISSTIGTRGVSQTGELLAPQQDLLLKEPDNDLKKSLFGLTGSKDVSQVNADTGKRAGPDTRLLPAAPKNARSGGVSDKEALAILNKLLGETAQLNSVQDLLTMKSDDYKNYLLTLEAKISETFAEDLSAVTGKSAEVYRAQGTDMQALLAEVSQLSLDGLSSTATSTGKILKSMINKLERLQVLEQQDFLKEAQRQAEAAEQAKKAAITSVVFDWVIAAAEVVSGIVKIAAGNYAGGVADLTAGISGIVKAAANTYLLANPDSEWAKGISKWAGYVQLGAEIVGAAIDVTNFARGMRAAAPITKATETVLTTGGKNVAGAAVGEIAKEVAQTATREVAQGLTGKLGQMLTQKFTEQAVEKMVKKGLEQALKSGVKLGEEAFVQTAKSFVKAEVKKAVQAGIKTAITQGMRDAVIGGQKIKNGLSDLSRADIEKQIEELKVAIEWVQKLVEIYGSDKQTLEDRLKTLTEQQTQVVGDASTNVRDLGSTMSKVAANLG